jgi:hypothetical protein
MDCELLRQFNNINGTSSYFFQKSNVDFSITFYQISMIASTAFIVYVYIVFCEDDEAKERI